MSHKTHFSLTTSLPHRHERPAEEARRHLNRGRGLDQGLLQDPPSDPQARVQDEGPVFEAQVHEAVPAAGQNGHGEEWGGRVRVGGDREVGGEAGESES